MCFKSILVFICAIMMIPSCFAMENAFYILRSAGPVSTAGYASLIKHYGVINLLIPQCWQVDEKGFVWGGIPSTITDFAVEQHVKVMPFITNAKYNPKKTHIFLSNRKAQDRALQSLMQACQQYGYVGVQFDFEMMPYTDRALLTAFYQHAADVLHSRGLLVSFAIAPVVADPSGKNDFNSRLYKVWEGVYDLDALGRVADFVSVMAYNQHTDNTTPGPSASLPWVEAVVQYALQHIPADKISLGVSVSSTHWYFHVGRDRTSTDVAEMSYADALWFLHHYHASLQWDHENQLYFAVYQRNWLNEYLYLEDARSISAKYALAEKYHLRGLSFFSLGYEDPAMWKIPEGQSFWFLFINKIKNAIH